MRRLSARRRALILTALLLGCVFRVNRTVSPGQLIGTAYYVSAQGKQLAAAGATVVLEESPLTTTTDSDGSFQFNGLPAGTYTVRISLSQGADSGGVGIRTSGITFGAGDGYDLGRFALTPFGSIVGTATVNGNPAGPSTIAAITGLSELRVSGGMYAFPNLPPGPYQVTVMSTDLQGVLTGTPATVQVVSAQPSAAPPATLTDSSSIASTGAVEGLVQIAGAASNGGATVQFSGGGPSLTTSASGGFTSGGVAPGLYTATYSMSGFQTVTVGDIIVAGDGTTTIPPVTLLPGSAPEPDAGPLLCFADSQCAANGSCVRGVCQIGAVGSSCTLGDNATCHGGPSPVCLSASQGTSCSSSCHTDSDCGAGGVCVTNLMAEPDAGTGDAGSAEEDAGSTDAGNVDAGGIDAGDTGADAGDASVDDAGAASADAGDASADAGAATVDAGTGADAGGTSADAGVALTDAGSPLVDAGSVDAGDLGSGAAGFCVSECGSNTDCSSSSVCDSWQDESGSMVNGCWVACAYDSDCGPGETCDSASGTCI